MEYGSTIIVFKLKKKKIIEDQEEHQEEVREEEENRYFSFNFLWYNMGSIRIIAPFTYEEKKIKQTIILSYIYINEIRIV